MGTLSQTNNRPLRICLISNEYPPETGWGGIGTYTYNMAQGLSALGHSVYVISRAVDTEKEYLDNWVRVYRISNEPFRVPILARFFPLTYERLARSYAVYKKMKELDEKYSLDIVEAPDWGAEGFFCAFHGEIITKIHTPLYIAYRLNRTKFTLDARIAGFLEKRQVLKSRGVNADSFALAREAERLWGIRDIEVTYCPIHGEISLLETRDNNIEGQDYILYFGQLSERKGVAVLTRAIGKVFEKNPNIKLVFDGQDMPYQDITMKQYILEINSRYKDRLIFRHTRSRPELFSIIKNARLIVLPSLWEGFGYACLEALSLGKVVIATRGSGMEEIILEDGVNGFLIDPGKVDALTDKIMECLNNSHIFSAIEERAKSRAAFFEREKRCREMVGYYRKNLEK